MRLLERLFAAGFRPIAIPPYENALCVHRGECVAVLTPVKERGLRLASPPTVLIEGHLSVKVKRAEGEVFVWKGKEERASAARLDELARFSRELKEILEQDSVQ